MVLLLSLMLTLSSVLADTRHQAKIVVPATPAPPCTLIKGEIDLPVGKDVWSIYFPPHPQSADYDYVMSCKNCPKGSDRYQPQMEMTFASDTLGTNPPISHPTTPITQRDFSMRTRVQVPAGYTTTINADLINNGIKIDASQTSITFQVFQHTSNTRKNDTLVPAEICLLERNSKAKVR
jgi:hypothetical protein